MANEIEHSRQFSEALLIAVQALRAEASQLRSSLDTDPNVKSEGSVRRIINDKIEENEQAADLLEGSLNAVGIAIFRNANASKVILYFASRKAL